MFEPREQLPEQTLRRAVQHVESLARLGRERLAHDQRSKSAPEVQTVGIVGAGLMGNAVAAAFAASGRQVWIADADQAALDTAPQRIADELARGYGVEKPEQVVQSQVHAAALEQFGRCDLILESIVENVAAKQQLLARIEARVDETTLLASNTSSIPLTRLAAGLRRPERFCGLHFCHPVSARPLVEVVRGAKTSEPTLDAAVGCAGSLEKIPIVVTDAAGFVVNRLLAPYVGEALALLLEGVEVEAVEDAARRFGMAKGPLSLLDEIGLDTALKAAWVLAEEYPERVVPSPVLVSLVKAGHLGCKTGAGFFEYLDHSAGDGQALGVNPQARQIIIQWAGPKRPCEAEQIAARLFLPMLLEATRLIEDGVVQHPWEIDLASIFALGFPSWRGGLLWWADQVGIGRIVEALEPLRRLGARAEPTNLLRHLARQGERFYASGH